MEEEVFSPFFFFFLKEVFSKMVSKGPSEEVAFKRILGRCSSLVGLGSVIPREESLYCLVLISLVPHKAIHFPKLPLTFSALSHGRGISQAQFFKAKGGSGVGAVCVLVLPSAPFWLPPPIRNDFQKAHIDLCVQ